MTRFFELLIAVVIVLALLVLFAVLLPSERTITHSVETNHPIRQVYDTLAGFKRFREWHPLRLHDPRIEYTLEGPDHGVGARLEYDSRNEDIGQGSWEIVDAAQDSEVVIAVENDHYGDDKTYRFLIEESDNGKTVTITQTYHVDYGWDLPGRIAGLYLPRNVGDDMKIGLNNLAGLIATMPNFDYSDIEVERVVVEPKNVLYVSASSERNITAVEDTMVRALRDIRRAIEQAGLEEDGPPRLVTTDFGDQTYDFDVAIPVAEESDYGDEPAEGEEDAAATEGDEAADEEAEAQAQAEEEARAMAEELADARPAGEEEDVCAVVPEPAPALEAPENLPSNVSFGQSYGGCALMTEYAGHPAALPLVRDMLRSYAAAHGFVLQDRAWEEYLDPIEDTAPEDSTFNVYWPIRSAGDPPNRQPAMMPPPSAEDGAAEGENGEEGAQADAEEADTADAQ